MVIVEVEHQKIGSVSDFEDAIEKQGNDSEEGTLMLVRTTKGSRFVVVKS